MDASDVMTRNVVTVTPDTEVRDIAALLLDHNISAVPVVDKAGRVLGIVSEGDLMRGAITGLAPTGGHRRSWWLTHFTGGDEVATDYLKAYGATARDVMTAHPVVVEESTPLDRVATLLERHHIKRVPVVRDGKLVGLVSRSNLLRGFSFAPAAPATATTAAVAAGEGAPPNDAEIRNAIHAEAEGILGVPITPINVLVSDGRVQLWGLVESAEQKAAVEVAAERTRGVVEVENNLGVVDRGLMGYGSA